MREIKFRCVYSGDNPKIMFDQVYIDGEPFFENKETGIMYGFVIPFIDDDFTLMQYTGMKDKNGIEIYEGDIIKHYAYVSCEPNLVFWDNKKACFSIQNTEEKGDIISIAEWGIKNYIIIGNIHE